MTDYTDTNRQLGTEITARIKRYRPKRDAPSTGDFGPLKQFLVDYPYGTQDRIANPENPAFLTAGSGNDDGTWDEVERAYAYGLLTRDEYYEVLRAVWEKYDPDRAQASRDGTIR